MSNLIWTFSGLAGNTNLGKMVINKDLLTPSLLSQTAHNGTTLQISRRPCCKEAVAQKPVVFLGFFMILYPFPPSVSSNKVPLTFSNLWCKSCVLQAIVSLTWSFWNMYLSWQNMAAAGKKLSSGNELCLGNPWEVAVYIFMWLFARPPKTKLCNVILFHCFTTNRRICQVFLIGLCCFSSLLCYFMLLLRKTTHTHKFLHQVGNIFESFLVPVKDHKQDTKRGK